MRTINVYYYDELPTEGAKAKAREWWVELEAECPAWFHEHFESMEKAIQVSTIQGVTKEELIKLSEELELTGYCADIFLSHMIKNLGWVPTPDQIEKHYNEEWEREIEDRFTDTEYIEESIRCNEYEFLEDGRRL